VSALLATRKVAQTQGGWLRLISVSRRARRLIELAGLQDTLALAPADPAPRPSRRPHERHHLALVAGAGT
jgi:anti-anti-sigma regulatory factor